MSIQNVFENKTWGHRAFLQFMVILSCSDYQIKQPIKLVQQLENEND